MRDAIELVREALRISRGEDNVGSLTDADILRCVTALEIAQHGSQTARTARVSLEYRPADLEAVREFVDRFPDISATAAEIYRGIYSRDPNAAEARSVAVAAKRLGMAWARSNGRTVWRHS